MSPELAILTASVFVFTLTAAVWDWRDKRLPNALTVPAFAAGLLFQLISGAVHSGLVGAGWGLVQALAGFGVGFGLLLVLWLIGGGGGGDVKFMGALGAWLGPVLIFRVFLVGAVLAVIGSMVVLGYEALRLGFGRAQARYVTAGTAKTKGSPEAIEESRQRAMVKRRIMPWAIPAALASWLVLAYNIILASTPH